MVKALPHTIQKKITFSKVSSPICLPRPICRHSLINANSPDRSADRRAFEIGSYCQALITRHCNEARLPANSQNLPTLLQYVLFNPDHLCCQIPQQNAPKTRPVTTLVHDGKGIFHVLGSPPPGSDTSARSFRTY